MTLRVAAALAAMAVTSATAQQAEPTRPQPQKLEIISLQDLQRPDVPEPPEPPAGASAWSLRVHTTGGFTGRGAGSVTISSDGRMACGPAPCTTSAVSARLESFGTAVSSAVVGAVWGPQPLSSLCSDCIRTTIVLKRREGDAVRIYRASWDDSQPVASELRDLRRLALELRSAGSAR